ncbi:MAG: methyl-accepting chemotaxis protein [Proteobacteria bacterium]|nr:methyl-accepting chemotaxis protein [Pseudomonadota bacterium]
MFVGLVASFFLIRQLYEQLSKITNVMTREAESQTIASRHIATSAHLLTLSTTEQGSAIEQTVSSMDEMAAMLSQTTQNAERSRVVSEKAQIDAKQGQIVIGKMKTAMEEIWANNQTLESLVGLINEIQFKTRVINDIVFETRLLSFNASIEAARAGVHGKGFAVVAEEVGKLALMSGKAADEIRALLENSTRQVSSIVKNTQERVTVGKNISEECAVVFNSMDDILTNIGKAIANIVVATKEQEVGVKQSNLAMAEIDRIIQKNSINAGDLAAQASKLGDGGKSLNAAVVDIRKLVFGNQSDNGSKESAHRILKSSEVQPEKNGFHKEVGDDSILTPKTNGEHREPGSSSADDIASGSANPKRNDSGWRKSA